MWPIIYLRATKFHLSLRTVTVFALVEQTEILREQHTLKYGDAHENNEFLKIQDLRPLNTCQKHFEMILLIFH